MDAFCVHCDERIDLGPGARVGQRVTCTACRAYLEVICVGPVELDWAYDEPHQDDRKARMQSDLEDTWRESLQPPQADQPSVT